MTFDADFHATRIEEQGYSVAEDLIPLELCEEIKKDISRMEAIGPPKLKQNEFTGYNTLRYFDLINKNSIWEQVATHPPVLEVIRRVLGQDMLLSTMGTAVIDPGESSQRIHCDDQLYGIGRPHKNLVCNTMWALSDFTCENGATRLVPGSNKFMHYPDENLTSEQRKAVTATGEDQNYATIQMAMPAGSIGFVVGTTYHSGAANKSSERRWGLTINYCAGSQRQQENLMLAHSRSKMRTFSDELLRILGVHPMGLGHIDAGDPRMILEMAD